MHVFLFILHTTELGIVHLGGNVVANVFFSDIGYSENRGLHFYIKQYEKRIQQMFEI